MSVDANQITQLNAEELDGVAGGPLPLLLVAFAKGVAVGATGATVAIAVADALDWVDAF